MPRDSRISATRPVFPTFLLPSLNFSLHRRLRPAPAPSPPAPAAAASASQAREPSAAATAPPTSRRPAHLSRAAPDTLRCINCSTDLALASQIVSKGFTGRYGRAFLVAPPPAAAADPTLANIRVGRSEDRQLVTGWHVVADICCATCSRKLGWKYVDAKEPSQRYKIGKFILEVERVVTHRCWEDLTGDDDGDDDDDDGDDDVPTTAQQAAGCDDDIVFDSDDDDECEDIFAGVWDAATVAKRRSQTIRRQLCRDPSSGR